MNAPRHAFLLSIMLVLVGCASVEPPDVFVTNITPLESQTLEQRVRVDLRILNPNDLDLPVRGMECRLDLNDTRLARGVSNRAFVVPALGETTTSIDATTSVFDIVRQLLVLTNPGSDRLTYRIAGRVFMERSARGMPSRLTFEHVDDLRLPDWTNDGMSDPTTPVNVVPSSRRAGSLKPAG